MLFKRVIVSVTYVITWFLVIGSSDSRPSREPFKPYAEAGQRDDGTSYAGAGAMAVNEWPFHFGFGEVGVEHPRDKLGGKAEVTLLRSKLGSEKHNLDANFLSASVDAGVGPNDASLMGRAALFDHTINTGPVGINYGVTADTGFKADGRNLEGKFLGIGGKVGADGIQVCFIVCLGFSW